EDKTKSSVAPRTLTIRAELALAEHAWPSAVADAERAERRRSRRQAAPRARAGHRRVRCAGACEVTARALHPDAAMPKRRIVLVLCTLAACADVTNSSHDGQRKRKDAGISVVDVIAQVDAPVAG